MLQYLEVVELNISEVCNLQCEFCPRSSGYPNRKLFMDDEVLDKVIESARELSETYKFDIDLAGRGEPTLHPNFKNILERLLELKRDTGIRITISTNGTRLEKFLDLYYQCDQVVFSHYYDKTDEEYEKNLKRFKDTNIAVRRKHGAIKAKKYTNRAGAIINRWTANRSTRNKFCFKPYTNMYINWNGDYNLCCDDWALEPEVFGNILTESIKDFFSKNEKLESYRQMLENNSRTKSPCMNCNRYTKRTPDDYPRL